MPYGVAKLNKMIEHFLKKKKKKVGRRSMGGSLWWRMMGKSEVVMSRVRNRDRGGP